MYSVVRDINWCDHYKKQHGVSSKIKNKIIIWSGYSIFGYLSEEGKNTNSKRHTHLYVHCNIIYNKHTMKTI